MMLRPYQQEAVDAATGWMRKALQPGLLELATGAGKSHIAAAIAHWVHDTSGKKVLVLQPSKELTEQNYEKYLATGNPASIFSAAAGKKSVRHNVVYGTPMSVKNKLSRFGPEFGCVIVDEAHETTPTIRFIIDQLRQKNDKLRVIGMTATPYTMGRGYIYQHDIDGGFVRAAREPYYQQLLYQVQTRELINQGYLTDAHADPSIIESYRTAHMELNRQGRFDAAEVEQAFQGHGRLTASIIADIVEHAAGRRGVMIFAATVEHAKECLASLPPGKSMMLGGDVNMTKPEREALINDFKAQRFKYLVSVGTLTRGFDATHVDLIAVLRATESPGLFQQIIGRGLRLHPGKSECLVLDYAENIERHELHDDLFVPRIEEPGEATDGEVLDVCCPWCAFENQFKARPNPDKFEIDDDGYFIDLLGFRVEAEDGQMPAHFGRRCYGQVRDEQNLGIYKRCEYRWTSKECEACEHHNDIAAKYCEKCRAELVDPNEKLQREYTKAKKDPYCPSVDKVLAWKVRSSISRSGNDVLVIEYTTEYRTFPVWYTPDYPPKWHMLTGAVFPDWEPGGIVSVDHFISQFPDFAVMPETITCYKNRKSGFFEITGYNETDEVSKVA